MQPVSFTYVDQKATATEIVKENINGDSNRTETQTAGIEKKDEVRPEKGHRERESTGRNEDESGSMSKAECEKDNAGTTEH